MFSLKKLLPSFLLLAIYLIADEFLPPLPALICLGGLGIGEFLYTRFKEKSTDWLILLLTVLFCVPVLLNLYKIQVSSLNLNTIIIEAGLWLFTGILAFSKANPLSTLPAPARKSIQFSPEQQRAMKMSLKYLFYILSGHLVLVFCAYFLLSSELQTFIGGPLLYMLIGIFLLLLFCKKYLQMKEYNKEEWLPLVNEKGEVTGKAPRSVCHSGSRLLHPVVHLQIINAKNEIFLQKRSMKKDLLPGMWDTAVGGHIGVNEKLEDALKRETFEELGITEFEARFNGSYLWESPREKELVFSFFCTRYNRININNDEVDEGRFWPIAEIEAHLDKNIFTPNFIHEYRQIIAPQLRKSPKGKNK